MRSKTVNFFNEEENIINAIEEAKQELHTSQEYFDMVNDPRLIDYAIYREQAAKVRLMYLISEARKKGISVNAEDNSKTISID